MFASYTRYFPLAYVAFAIIKIRSSRTEKSLCGKVHLTSAIKVKETQDFLEGIIYF